MNPIKKQLPSTLDEMLRGRIASGEIELPILPSVAQEILRVSASDESDARRLSDLIRRDQAIASHVLRAANSPVYGSRSPIVSLQQATSRLGTTTIKQMALMISCQTRAFQVKGHEARVRDLFRHSMATSFIAQEVARARRWNVEEAFLCGLLHDVGRPVVLQAMVDLQSELACPLEDEAIESAMDEHHTKVGADIAMKWKFFPRLIDTILHHHTPPLAKEGANFAFLVALADDVAHHLCGPRAVEAESLASHPSLSALNLYPEDLENLLARKDDVIAWIEGVS